jgi:electron-transferring-flavoprotein dehydrogenase
VAVPDEGEKTGEDMVSIGFVVDLDYADATTSVHDLLQQFKLHPLVRGILDGGERVAWGAKALPGGGYWSMPKLSMPGAVLVGDAGGMVNTTALKGLHYAIKAGMLAAESIYAALRRGETSLASYEEAVDDSVIGKELWEVRNTRQPLAQKGLIKGGPLTNVLIATKGRFPAGACTCAARTRRRCSSATRRRAIPSRTASTRSTSCRRSTSRATRPRRRARTTSACRSTCR